MFLVNIDLNQVFHLHNTTKGPITVVYKKLPKKDISDVNAILEIDETDHVRSHKLFDNKSTDELLQYVHRYLCCGYTLVD